MKRHAEKRRTSSVQNLFLSVEKLTFSIFTLTECLKDSIGSAFKLSAETFSFALSKLAEVRLAHRRRRKKHSLSLRWQLMYSIETKFDTQSSAHFANKHSVAFKSEKKIEFVYNASVSLYYFQVRNMLWFMMELCLILYIATLKKMNTQTVLSGVTIGFNIVEVLYIEAIRKNKS